MGVARRWGFRCVTTVLLFGRDKRDKMDEGIEFPIKYVITIMPVIFHSVIH